MTGSNSTTKKNLETTYQESGMSKKIPLDTRRRIYNLSLAGWTTPEIIRELGVSQQSVRQYMAVSARSKRRNFKP